MKLTHNIAELLADFNKRMKFINIVRYLFEYSYKDSIKAMIPDKEILDNIIVAVLVFIKEQTLGNEKTCKLEDIADFLDEISIILPNECKINSNGLAKFIVVDVLQKGGVLTNYKVISFDKEIIESSPVRLIEEEKNTYHLTDDAFDFLFRSKEIESELDYSVTRFRLQEYMKRNNYTEALNQSRELVSKIRNMKISIDDFMHQCRENIAKITVDQYETVISRIRNLLETEYEELKNIQNATKKRFEDLSQLGDTSFEDECIIKQRKALIEITKNIQLTIAEQRTLINKKMTLSEAYKSILNDSYAITQYERLNFEKDILSKMKNGDIPLDTASLSLLFPLVKPEFKNIFSIENIYAIQSKISDDIEEETEEIPEDLDNENHEIEIKNNRFLGICTKLFEFISLKDSFKISEFISYLENDTLFDFCEENSLPQVILTLYSYQNISIENWKTSPDMIVEPIGEFDFSWCLSELNEKLLELKEFSITKIEREFSFSVFRNEKKNNISMSDFVIEVKR